MAKQIGIFLIWYCLSFVLFLLSSTKLPIILFYCSFLVFIINFLISLQGTLNKFSFCFWSCFFFFCSGQDNTFNSFKSQFVGLLL